MCTDKLHEYASELKRYVDDQAIFVAAEIEDHPVVGHEIHGSAELSLYLGGISPSRFGDSREPRPDRSLCTRVTRPGGMRWTRMARETNVANADGEVVWSRPPDAAAKVER